MDLFELFNQSWLGTLFGLIGVVLAAWGIISVRRSKIGPLPVYETRSVRLISKEEKDIPDEVEISFGNKTVPRLTRSFVIFWNDGTSTIDGENIVRDDRLRLELEDKEEILKSSIIKRTREANKVRSTIDATNPNVATIDFEYLDAGDGVVIELLHTSTKRHPIIAGTIKGVPNGIRVLSNIGKPFNVKLFNNLIRVTRPFLYVTVLLGLILIFSAFLPESFFELLSESKSEPDLSVSSKGRFALMILGGMYSFAPIVLLWSMRRKYPKKLHTNELGEL